MEPKQIIEAIKKEAPAIKTVYFVGCGASMSDLFPAKYFLEKNAKELRTSLYTANNFNYSTPAAVDNTSTTSLVSPEIDSITTTDFLSKNGFPTRLKSAAFSM